MIQLNQCRNLKDLRENHLEVIPNWIVDLPDNTTVSIHRYNFGELVYDSGTSHDDSGHKLNLVLNGDVEIYDSSIFDNVIAYRPIRILEPGEVFGDFELIDNILECNTPFGVRETFKLVAGRRCLLSIEMIDSELGLNPAEGNPIELYQLLNDGAIQPAMPTVDIATLKLNNAILNEESFMASLLSSAWIKAKAYRDSVNAFNLSSLLEFRLKAIDWKNRNNVKSQYAQLGLLLQAFSDALLDAIFRPIANEPLYQLGFPDWCKEAAKKRLSYFNISEEKILSASSAYGNNTLYFPLDLHNIFVNKYLSNEPGYLSRNQHAKRTFVRKIDNVFPNTERNSGKSGHWFYLGLANHLADIYAQEDDYSFRLECTIGPGPTRPMMLLSYDKK